MRLTVSELTRYDAAIFVYNLAIVVATPALYERIELTVDTQLPFLFVSMVFAAGWTLYFNLTLRRTLQSADEEEDDGEGDDDGE
jgi:hypothetical protein